MKKVFAVLLSLMLIVSCAAALAETAADDKICTYVVYNTTGEKVTELYLIDNASGEKGENLAGENGLADLDCVSITGENYEGYVKTLSFKTEIGYEAAFTTLHFENVPISLLPAPKAAAEGTDATTGATPISFTAPSLTATYTLVNQTGEKIKEVTFTNNVDGTAFATVTDLDKDATFPYSIGYPADKTGKESFELTLKFVTESGYEGTFTTLHFETVTINLLSADAMTGATQISFGPAPAAE